MNTKSKQKRQADAVKKNYTQPQLTHYGTIRELTTGGTAGCPENNVNCMSPQKMV